MNDGSPNATQPPPQAPPGDSGTPPLYRPVVDRVVAGVSGGLGRHFGVDPVIFRVVFVVLTLFGGLGVLLYGLGWLLMPADDHPTPLARDVLSHRNLRPAVMPVVVTCIGIAIFFSYIEDGFDDGAFPLLVVAGIILYISRQKTRRQLRAAGLEPGGLATAGVPSPPAAAMPAAAGPSAGPAAGPPADAPVAGPALAPGPAKWWRTAAEPAEPAPPRPRSYLTAATLSLATVVGGLMWWIDGTTGADISYQVALAVILAVLAGGLLVGTFFGRGRWLIVPALAVTALLSVVAAITVPITGSTGERTITPATATAVESPYRMKAGDMRIYLTQLDPGPAGVRIVATLGAGTLKVRIPDDVRVVVEASADIGEVQLPNGSSSGLDAERKTVLEPRAGTTSRGTITLDLGVGLGNVEVLYDTP